MKLPFSDLPISPDSAFPHRTAIVRPIAALLLTFGERQVVTFAIVDSGADNCVFPASIAERLGIPIPNDRKSSFSGSTEGPQTAYYAEVQATILPMDAPHIEPGQEPLSFSLYAGFCETLEHVGMGLLGQDGFFSHFAVSFYNPQSYFEIL